ncbi:hypothetical protein Peur_012746 [Populus x canadensis]
MESSPSDGEVAVFADTDTDTHISMGVSLDMTVTDFNSNFLSIFFPCLSFFITNILS